MGNSWFSFKQFTIAQDKAAFKVGTDGVLLGAVADTAKADHILDIGTGTGLVAIMLAQRSNAKIHAIEPDPDSFQQCIENINACPWKERIEAEMVSLRDFRPSARFDLIVSNPPYFTDSLKNPDPRKSAARHNDTLGNDELLEGVSSLISEKGKFQVILPWAEGNVLIATAAIYGLYCNEILKIRPTSSAEIRRMLITFSREKIKVSERFLTIEQGARHEFTQQYIDLTRDFYIRF
jgi:tRNA1Val (adenine37-N6)-methyltransferase